MKKNILKNITLLLLTTAIISVPQIKSEEPVAPLSSTINSTTPNPFAEKKSTEGTAQGNSENNNDDSEDLDDAESDYNALENFLRKQQKSLNTTSSDSVKKETEEEKKNVPSEEVKKEEAKKLLDTLKQLPNISC